MSAGKPECCARHAVDRGHAQPVHSRARFFPAIGALWSCLPDSVREGRRTPKTPVELGRTGAQPSEIDEGATLTAYQPDRKLRARIDRSVGLLLSQGRGPGVSVLAALQDPRMEVLGFRGLFPTRVALQLDEAGQVDMVLGPGARDQGALCDKIPDSTRGVAYVRVQGVREPARVRAAYVSDDDIAAMAAAYAAPRRLDGEQLFQAAEHDVDAEVIDITPADEQPKRADDDNRQAS